MDVIPLDANLVKGSHGRINNSEDDWPLFFSQLRLQILRADNYSHPKVINCYLKYKNMVFANKVLVLIPNKIFPY